MNPMSYAQKLKSPSRFAQRLDARRSDKLDELFAANAPLVAELAAARDALARGANEEASRTLERGARMLLGDLRGMGGDGSAVLGAASWVDAAIRSERVEILDRDACPTVVKNVSMRMLHAVNVAVDSYGVWERAIAEVLGGRDGVHVYDLAAGTGGFARYLARRSPRARGLRITSSDLDPRYVAIGEAKAHRQKLDVAYEQRNALALREVRGVDLFVCTQATHHLSPGQVVEMIAGAVASAPEGLLIVDLQRSLFSLAVTATFLAAFAQPLFHDGVLSVQRSYAASELRLLARIAGADDVRTWLPSAAATAMHARKKC